MILFFLVSCIFSHVGLSNNVFGVKHVKISDNECAMIVGRYLNDGETVFREERLMSPCINTPYHFNFNNDYDNYYRMRLIYITKNLTLMYYVADYYAFYNFLDSGLSLRNCFDEYDDSFRVIIKNSIRNYKINAEIYGKDTKCECVIDNCKPIRSETIPNCVMYDSDHDLTSEYDDVDNCTSLISILKGIRIYKSAANIYTAIDANNTVKWNYYLPEYDFIYQHSYFKVKPTMKFIRFVQTKMEDKCTIAIYYAFKRYPVYYYDVKMIDNDNLKPYCFTDYSTANFALQQLPLNFERTFVGCFLNSTINNKTISLQCGTLVNSYFIYHYNAIVDMSECDFFDKNDFYFYLNGDHYSIKAYIRDFTEGKTCESELFRYYYANGNIQVKFSAINVKPSEGNYSFYYKENWYYHFWNVSGDKLFKIRDSDGLIENTNYTIEGVIMHRLYSIKYKKIKEDKCYLAYVGYPDNVLSIRFIPCIPESSSISYHLYERFDVILLEVCHYNQELHLINCFDHYTNATVIYQLDFIKFYNYNNITLYSYKHSLFITDYYFSYRIERDKENVYKYTVTTDNQVYTPYDWFTAKECVKECNDLQKYQEQYSESFTIDNNNKYYFIGGTVIFKQNKTFFYINNLSKSIISENADFSFLLKDFRHRFYIPDTEVIDMNCDSKNKFLYGFKPVIIVVCVDVVLFIVFIIVFTAEINGYRKYTYSVVKNDLVEQKLKAMEAIGNVLL